MRLPAPLLALALLGFSRLAAQEFVPLDFSQNVQATNALYPNNSILGPAYYSGTTFDFINVATVNGQSIDARFSVTSVAPNYEFEGWIPAYNGPIISNSNFGYPDNRQPSDQGDDVGIYYHSVHSPVETTGHLSVKLEFFTGGGNFNSLIMLDSIALMLYDHDGEPGQSESIRAHLNDGLQGYSIRNDSGITAQMEGDSIIFNSGGSNHSELTSDGGFILHYNNVSSVQWDFLARTSPWLAPGNNGIFHALDGNLSLVNPADFGTYQAVPEPTTMLLSCAAALMLTLRRNRENPRPQSPV